MDSSSAPVFAEALYEGLVRATRGPGVSPTTRILPRPRTPTPAVRTPVPVLATSTTGPQHPATAGPLLLERDLRQGDPGWNESRRLSRWLHDELGNALAVALHRIELGEDDPSRAAPHLAVAKRALGEAIRENRNLLGALRRSSSTPPVREALRQWLADMESQAQVSIRVTGNEALASERCRRELFLVLREALRNCLEHAGAERIEVTVRTTRRWLYARVQDDGAGFTVEDAVADNHHGRGHGHGLRAMRGRTEDLGGRLRIGSNPGEGTCVEIHLPLSMRP